MEPASRITIRPYNFEKDRKPIREILYSGGIDPWTTAYHHTWQRMQPIATRLLLHAWLWTVMEASAWLMLAVAITYEMVLAWAIYDLFLEDA